MSIRVLVISDYRKYHSTRGEAEIFIQLAKRGFKIRILTFRQGKHIENFERVGIDITDFHPIKRLDRAEIQFIRKQAIDWMAEIVYLFNSRAILNGIQAVKKLECKVVLYRGLSANVQWYDPTMYFKFYHSAVDKVVCNSIGVREAFEKQGVLKAEKLVTINKGHRISWYESPTPYDIRRELKLKEDTVLFFNVSVNRKMKGIPYLLEAISLLPSELDFILLLIGSDMDDQANLKAIKKYQLEEKVKILGYRTDALNIMASCDVKVLPSISGESINKSVMESMALGKAVIISDIAGNKELIENETSGLIFPNRNVIELKKQILKLYLNPSLRKNLGSNAKKRIRDRFNIDDTVDQTEVLFKELVSK